MKILLVGALMLWMRPLFSLAETAKETENKEEKASKAEQVYSEKEFQEKVSVEVKRKLRKILGGNITQFSDELFAKELSLKSWEEKLKKREEQLKHNSTSLENKIKELKLEQEELLGCLSKHKKEEDQRLDRLVTMIEGMKPAQAAQVLSVQDADLAVKVFQRIEAARASKIFNLMEKEVSARLQKQFMTMKR